MSTPTHTCAAWPSNPVEALGVRYEKTLTDSLASAVFRRIPRRLELGAVVGLGPRGFRALPHATHHANDTLRFCLGLGHPDGVHSSRRKKTSSPLLVYLPHLSGDAYRWSSALYMAATPQTVQPGQSSTAGILKQGRYLNTPRARRPASRAVSLPTIEPTLGAPMEPTGAAVPSPGFAAPGRWPRRWSDSRTDLQGDRSLCGSRSRWS